MSSKGWDARSGKKLAVFIDRAEILTTIKHGTEETRNPFVMIHISGVKNKQQQRTRVEKHTLKPRWKEVFFFEVPYDRLPDPRKKSSSKYKPVLVLDFMDSALRDRTIGTAEVPLTDVMEDVMVVTTKRIRKDVKNKTASESASVVGKCQFHLFFSSMTDFPRPTLPVPVSQSLLHFPYDRSMVQFSPGDVILYSTTGPLAALLRVSYGAQWSHCGIVVSLPNKWTLVPELCVVEFGSNKENFVDFYNERPIHNGPMIFRLAERIHGFHGTEAWVLQMREPLNEQHSQGLSEWALTLSSEFYANVTTKVKEDHPSRVPFTPFTFNQSQSTFLESFGLNIRNPVVYSDFYAAQLVARALKYIGIEVKHQGTIVQIRDLVSSGFFADPFLIRCRQMFVNDPYWPAPPKQQQLWAQMEGSKTVRPPIPSADGTVTETFVKDAKEAGKQEQQPQKVEQQAQLDLIGGETVRPGLLSIIGMSEKKSEPSTDTVLPGLSNIDFLKQPKHDALLYQEVQSEPQRKDSKNRVPQPSVVQQGSSSGFERYSGSSFDSGEEESIEQDAYDEESSSDSSEDEPALKKIIEQDYDVSDDDDDDGQVLVNTSAASATITQSAQNSILAQTVIKHAVDDKQQDDDVILVTRDDPEINEDEYDDVSADEYDEDDEDTAVGGSGAGEDK